MAKEKKLHFTARISEKLIQKINDAAAERETTITAIVEDAFKRYFNEPDPNQQSIETLQQQIDKMKGEMAELARNDKDVMALVAAYRAHDIQNNDNKDRE